MRRKLLPLILGGALSIAAIAPASAATSCVPNTDASNRGGAAALAGLIAVAANVQANVVAGVCDIDVDILNNSLNNILQNADIDVLNNSLNNLLRNSDIIDDVTVNVLSGTIDVDLLSGDDFTINLVQ